MPMRSRRGPWIFLTGHEAFDFESGIPEEVAGPAGFPLFGRPRSRREGDFILQRMRRILREFGSDLGNGVRLDQYYPSPAAVDPYHLARHAEFGDYIPPSTSVVMERCFASEVNISTSLIAVMPGYEIHKIYPPGIGSAPSSGFVPAVVCDDFVFVAGQMAHNAGGGLDPRAHVSDHAAWAGTERIYKVLGSCEWFEDPGFSIPPEITKITGITDQMVTGHRIDDGAVDDLLSRVVLVIAHHADFDRRFLEKAASRVCRETLGVQPFRY